MGLPTAGARDADILNVSNSRDQVPWPHVISRNYDSVEASVPQALEIKSPRRRFHHG